MWIGLSDGLFEITMNKIGNTKLPWTAKQKLPRRAIDFIILVNNHWISVTQYRKNLSPYQSARKKDSEIRILMILLTRLCEGDVML